MQETPMYDNSDYLHMSHRKSNIQRNVHKYVTPYNTKHQALPESMITSAYTPNDLYLNQENLTPQEYLQLQQQVN